MNDTALRGLLSVSFLMWLPSGFAEKISTCLPSKRAKVMSPFLPLNVATDGPTRTPMTITQIPASKLAIRTTGPP